MTEPSHSKVADPSLIQVEASSRCNLRCQMCPVTTKGTLSTQNPGLMASDVWEKVRRIGSRVGKVVMTGFGEPFLHPDFLDMLRELDSRGIAIGFSTNGILVTDEIARELAGLEHLAHINVSIDSPDPDIYREVRRGDVHRALEGLAKLVRGVGDDGPLVTVSSLLMARTAESLIRFPEVLQRLGVRHWRVQSMVDWNRDLLSWHLCRGGRPADYLDRIRAEAVDREIDLIFENPERTELESNSPELAVLTYHGKSDADEGESRICNAPWDAPFVDKDGRVLPCCYGDHTAVLGDLRDESFDEIWNGPKYRRFREDLVKGGRSLPTICANCTQAPAGKHPRGQFVAEVLREESALSGDGPYRLVVRNLGQNTWDHSSLLRIGTIEPQNRGSAFIHAGWISANRVGTFSEQIVPPGGRATFEFHCTRGPVPVREAFQLVADGLKWIESTRFELTVDGEPIPVKDWMWRIRHAIGTSPIGGPVRRLMAKLLTALARIQLADVFNRNG